MTVEKYFLPFHSEGSAPSQAFPHEVSRWPALEGVAPFRGCGGVSRVGQPEVQCLVKLLTHYSHCHMKMFSKAGVSTSNRCNQWGELQNLRARLCNWTRFLDCCNMCTPVVLLLIFWIKSCVRSQMAWEHLVSPTIANTSSHKKKKIELWFHRFFIS